MINGVVCGAVSQFGVLSDYPCDHFEKSPTRGAITATNPSRLQRYDLIQCVQYASDYLSQGSGAGKTLR